jgi:hypothetical protein
VSNAPCYHCHTHHEARFLCPPTRFQTPPVIGFDLAAGDDAVAVFTRHELPLDVLKCGNSRRVTSFELDYKTRLTPVLESLEREMRYEIDAYITSTVARQHYVRYPATWVQALKERFLPAWAKARWPVRHTVVEITARLLFPSMPPPTRKGEPYFWVEGVLTK